MGRNSPVAGKSVKGATPSQRRAGNYRRCRSAVRRGARRTSETYSTGTENLMDANTSGTLPTRDELNAELLEVPEPPEQPEAINEPAYEDVVAVALRHVRG